MTERSRPVYCTRCGGIVGPGEDFCGVCGTRVSREALPTRRFRDAPGASGSLVLGLGAVLALLICIGAIVGLALAGNGKTEASRAGEPAAKQQKTPEETAGEPPGLGVGDSVEAGGVEATLNGVRILQASGRDRPTQNPDNRFLAADLTFENVSDDPVPISLELALENEEGYSASRTEHTQQKDLEEGEISPGTKSSGEIVYEVPPKSRGLHLEYRPFGRGATHTWAIGDLDGVAVAPRPREPEPAVQETTARPPFDPSAEVVDAAEDYYMAVDREDWAYTYANLDATTRALYTEEEWYRKNQYFADTEGLELSTIDVGVEERISDTEVGVIVYRTFEDGTTIERYTLFVLEDETWKHRFTDEENAIFQPGVPYEEFVSGGS